MFVWEMWNHGNSGGVAATGVIMITALLIVTLGLRALSFGRAAAFFLHTDHIATA